MKPANSSRSPALQSDGPRITTSSSSEKGSRILWMAERLRAGVVWANTYNRFDPTSPFGGYKESGFGREGGRHGLEPYLSFGGSETFGG